MSGVTNPGQLQAVQALLADFGRHSKASLDELRILVNERNGQYPLPESMQFESVEVARSDKPMLRMILGTPSGCARHDVILYLHGGGFVLGDAVGYRGFAGTLADESESRVLIVDYRLAPEHPFPAALEDAVDAYEWLLGTGTPASAIVVAGDSAGANLVLSVLSVVRNRDLPMPVAATVFSPWVDLSLAGSTITSKQTEELMLSPEVLRGCAQAYLGNAAEADPLASPLSADLQDLPPLLIQVGSAEILLDDSVRLAARAGAQGVKVRLDVWPHMPHVWHSFAPMLDEGLQAIREAAAFLRSWLDRKKSLDVERDHSLSSNK